MWTNEVQSKAPSVSPAPRSGSPIAPSSEGASNRTHSPAPTNLSLLGSTLTIKGTISGTEDLEIYGKVEGAISLVGQKLTVGPSGQLTSEITTREAVVHGKISGNICAGDRVEIKKGSEVIGDIITARIKIDDGAHFKGCIEIDRTKSSVTSESVDRSVVTFGN